MRESDPIDRLIYAYFDGVLNEADREALERVLQEDPDAARRFVRAARFENDLYTHFHRHAAREAVAAALARAHWPSLVAATRPRWAVVVDHLWGPLGAVLAHAAVLLLLVRWVVVPALRPSTPIEVMVSREERLILDPFRAAKESVSKRQEDAMPLPLQPPEWAVSAPPDPVPPRDPESPLPRGRYDGRLWAEPAWMRGRTPESRTALLARHAPTWAERTEPALDRALDWLSRARLPEGGWAESSDQPADPKLTGLAVLAFLARGEPATSIQREIMLLSDLVVTRQDDLNRDPEADGVVACALIEAWARIPLPPLRLAAEQAIENLIASQNAAGGWTDASPWTSVWRTLALRTAHWAGLEMPESAVALSRLIGGWKTLENPAVGLYQGPKPSRRDVERTAAIALALQWLREENTAQARAALARLRDLRPSDLPSGFARHLLAQVRFNEGGELWIRDRDPLAASVLAGQQRDGGWTSAEEGRLAETALAALTLTVCYRFPPASEWPAWTPVTFRQQPLLHGTSTRAMLAGLSLP